MIFDDERREAARRLRKTRVERYNSILNGIHLGEIVGVGAQIVSPHEDQVRAAADRLADLIEPERTCRMIDNGCGLCCSECDGRHDYDEEPNYCHDCGARVVDE